MYFFLLCYKIEMILSRRNKVTGVWPFRVIYPATNISDLTLQVFEAGLKMEHQLERPQRRTVRSLRVCVSNGNRTNSRWAGQPEHISYISSVTLRLPAMKSRSRHRGNNMKKTSSISCFLKHIRRGCVWKKVPRRKTAQPSQGSNNSVN